MARVVEARSKAVQIRLQREQQTLSSLNSHVQWLGNQKREYATLVSTSARELKLRSRFADSLSRAQASVEARVDQQRRTLHAVSREHQDVRALEERYRKLAQVQTDALRAASQRRDQKANDEVAASRGGRISRS